MTIINIIGHCVLKRLNFKHCNELVEFLAECETLE